MRQLSEAQATSLIPKYWRVLAASTSDILFLGKVNIRGMIRSWRYDADSLASQMKNVDEKLTFLRGKNAEQIKAEAARFEKPDFPKIGINESNPSGEFEPLDQASITRKRGATTFNFCGWCKHTGGGSCRYNYYITASCSFKTSAGSRTMNGTSILPASCPKRRMPRWINSDLDSSSS